MAAAVPHDKDDYDDYNDDYDNDDEDDDDDDNGERLTLLLSAEVRPYGEDDEEAPSSCSCLPTTTTTATKEVATATSATSPTATAATAATTTTAVPVGDDLSAYQMLCTGGFEGEQDDAQEQRSNDDNAHHDASRDQEVASNPIVMDEALVREEMISQRHRGGGGVSVLLLDDSITSEPFVETRFLLSPSSSSSKKSLSMFSRQRRRSNYQTLLDHQPDKRVPGCRCVVVCLSVALVLFATALGTILVIRGPLDRTHPVNNENNNNNNSENNNNATAIHTNDNETTHGSLNNNNNNNNNNEKDVDKNENFWPPTPNETRTNDQEGSLAATQQDLKTAPTPLMQLIPTPAPSIFVANLADPTSTDEAVSTTTSGPTILTTLILSVKEAEATPIKAHDVDDNDNEAAVVVTTTRSVACIGSSSLTFPTELYPGQFLCSPSRNYRFGLSSAGDLVILNRDNHIHWTARPALMEGGGTRLALQPDGNLVVYDQHGQPLLASATETRTTTTPTRLTVSDNGGGVAAVERDGRGVLWTTAWFPILPDTVVTLPPSMHPQCTTQQHSAGRLNAGQFVCSPASRYRFGLPSAERPVLVVLDNRNDATVWTSGNLVANTNGQRFYLNLRADGTLALVNDQSNTDVVVLGQANNNNNNNGGGTTTLTVDDLGVAAIRQSRVGYTWSTATANPAGYTTGSSRTVRTVVDATTLDRKIMMGYQGWFAAYGDRGSNRWTHWSRQRSRPPEPGILAFDMWPDLRELEPDELYETNLVHADGRRATLFSSYNTKTVERHVRWMYDYGLDGVFVQRFVRTIAQEGPEFRDHVLDNVRGGCEKYGRTFAVMYDIVGGISNQVVNEIINDWKHLVDDERITQSPRYLHHDGKPLVAIWGIGFIDIATEVDETNHILNFFQNEGGMNTEERYRTSVMAGVPVGWRDLTRDSQRAPAWTTTFRRFDVLSPWTVGRYATYEQADQYRDTVMVPDLRECQQLGIEYLPVAWPGFSQANLSNKPINEIPRRGGRFFWRQLRNILSAGNSMVYVAMFDEVDEATAIFKVADSRSTIPTGANLLTLNEDSCTEFVPSDWYLQLTGEATRSLQQRQTISDEMPPPGSIDGWPLILPSTNPGLSIQCLDRGPQAQFALQLNEYICSPSRAYALGLNQNGNLGVWATSNGRLIWSAGTEGEQGTRMIMQSDGNLVVYGPSSEVLFASSTVSSGGASSLIVDNRGVASIIQGSQMVVWTSSCVDQGRDGPFELGLGEFICSPDGIFRFGLTNSGNLGLFNNRNGQRLWDAGIQGSSGTRMVLQSDGNLVVYGTFAEVLFTTSTVGASESETESLIVDNGGVVSVVHATGGVVWTTGSCTGRGPRGPFELALGEYICSPDRNFRFGMTHNGNLVVINGRNGQQIWGAGTQGGSGTYMSMQQDGNLVVLGPGEELLFSTSTLRRRNNRWSSLSVDNNGVVTMIRRRVGIVWTSGCLGQRLSGMVELGLGEYLCSPSWTYRFGLTSEARLRVFLPDSDEVRWDAGIQGDSGTRLVLQVDGNLVVYNSRNTVLFATGTDTSTEHVTSVGVNDDGVAALLREGPGLEVWASGDQCRLPSAVNLEDSPIGQNPEPWSGPSTTNLSIHRFPPPGVTIET